MFPDGLSTLSIRYIKRYKLRQTNCNEFLDNFAMKKAGKNFLTVYCVMFSLTDSMIVAFNFFKRISIITA